jgi:hypothetical protein
MRPSIAIILMLTACLITPSLSAGDDCAASMQAVPICTVLADAAKYDGRGDSGQRPVSHGDTRVDSNGPCLPQR